MKVLKKLLVSVISLVMVVSMAAIAACKNSESGDVSDMGNEENVAEEDGNESGEQLTKEEQALADLFAAIREPGAAVSADFDLSTDSVFNTYKQANGGFLPEPVTTVEKSQAISTDLKFNVQQGDMDIEIALSQSDGGENVQTEYLYNFIRYWNEFTYSSGQPVTDFSDVVFTYEGISQASDVFYELYHNRYARVYKFAETILWLPAPLLASVAMEYDAVALSEQAINVNINALIYGIYTNVVKFIGGLTSTTTLEQIVSNDFVKTFIDASTFGANADDFLDELAVMLDSGIFEELIERVNNESQNTSTFAAYDYTTQPSASSILQSLLPQATEGESVHSYILDVLNSEQTALAFGLEDTVLADITLGQIMAFVSASGAGIPDIDTLKSAAIELLEQCTECTPATFSVLTDSNKNTTLKLENAEMVISFNNKDEMSVAFSCNLISNSIYYDDSTADGIVKHAEITERRINLNLYYWSQNLELRDIYNLRCNCYTDSFEEKTEYVQIGSYLDYPGETVYYIIARMSYDPSTDNLDMKFFRTTYKDWTDTAAGIESLEPIGFVAFDYNMWRIIFETDQLYGLWNISNYSMTQTRDEICIDFNLKGLSWIGSVECYSKNIKINCDVIYETFTVREIYDAQISMPAGSNPA